MISEKIRTEFNHQFVKKNIFNNHIFVADYTEQTKTSPVKRGVEFFSNNPPNDLSYFTIKNDNSHSIIGIDFDNNSFTRMGQSLSQCEAVFFSQTSSSESWVLFCELKYSSITTNNSRNLSKAIKQLYKTRYYYFQKNIISKTNTSYLIGSLPLQSEPFQNFTISQPLLTKLKRKRNIVLRFKNSVEIINDKIIQV